MTTENIINSTGVALALIAYFLLAIKKLKQNSILYYLLNFFGGSLTCYGSYLINAIPFVVLEGVWALIALMGLINSNKRTSE